MLVIAASISDFFFSACMYHAGDYDEGAGDEDGDDDEDIPGEDAGKRKARKELKKRRKQLGKVVASDTVARVVSCIIFLSGMGW